MSDRTHFDNAIEFAKLGCDDEKKKVFCLSQGNCRTCRERELEIIKDAHDSDIERVGIEEYQRGYADGESMPWTSTPHIDDERRSAASEIRKIDAGSGGFLKNLAKALGIVWHSYGVNRDIAMIRDRLAYLIDVRYEHVIQEPFEDSHGHIDDGLETNSMARLEERCRNQQKECGMYRMMLNQAREEFVQLQKSYFMAQDERRSLEQRANGDSACIELPKDADGNTVNIGDTVEGNDGRTMKVIGIKPNGFFWMDGSYEDHPHIKQRGSKCVRVVPDKKQGSDTIESLMREAFDEGRLSVYVCDTEYHEKRLAEIVSRAEAARG